MLRALLAVAAFALGGSADVVVYNGRSQYGDEQAFKSFEEQTGLEVELRGGTAPELFERLRREGAETPADLLVTTDYRSVLSEIVVSRFGASPAAVFPGFVRSPVGVMLGG